MFRRLKLIALVIAVVAVAGVALMGIQAYELKTNYTLVDAKIMSVKTECFIKERKEKIVVKGTSDLAYMECGLAEIVAKQHGFKAGAVKKRVTVTYDYRSPVDGHVYSGGFTRTDDMDGLKRGKMIQVHAHKTNAQDSRTTHANLFLEDTGA